MAHKINDLLNKAEGKKKVKCTSACKYYKFPHLETACLLSDVFSVKKGEMCFEFVDKGD